MSQYTTDDPTNPVTSRTDPIHSNTGINQPSHIHTQGGQAGFSAEPRAAGSGLGAKGYSNATYTTNPAAGHGPAMNRGTSDIGTGRAPMMEDTGAGMGAGTAGYAGTASNKGTGIKAALATVHGVGEMVRGEFNAKMDEMGGDPVGVAKNERIANEGLEEFETGRFSQATKAREGAVSREH